MFWQMASLTTSSPVEMILDKEEFTLEELLDEDEIIQECKSLNSRLINFLRDRAQVEQLLCYIVKDPPEDADHARTFKFPFISCEIFTCEVDVIFKTLVEDEELLDLLFSFLKPNNSHSSHLAGYFSKVVQCLMLRKTSFFMAYVQDHSEILHEMVDLIGITSIMEILVRFVSTDDHAYPNFTDVLQWLADSNLLEMIINKLHSSNLPEVQANAAETLCAVTRNSSSPLALKLSSSSFVARIFAHSFEDLKSKSTLVHCLSLLISLLDPKRVAISPFLYTIRNHHLHEPSNPAKIEAIMAMLPKLGTLLSLLDVSFDQNILPTTYGQLQPPLGKHRLKIVEFLAVLLRTENEVAEQELVTSGIIKRILDLFLEYPFNNALHHHVESIIASCLESKNGFLVKHLFQDCNLIDKLVQTDKDNLLTEDSNHGPTLPSTGRKPLRRGNLGHITRIANKIVHFGNENADIQSCIQGNAEWIDWQNSVLNERNMVENVYRWTCGRPNALHEIPRDSDEDELQDRDYEETSLRDDLSQVFRYNVYEIDDTEEVVHGSLERNDEDVYFDDESAEVVLSSLRLGDDYDSSLFTNSNWFAFQEDQMTIEPPSVLTRNGLVSIDLKGVVGGCETDSDDEVVVGPDEDLVEDMNSINELPGPKPNILRTENGSMSKGVPIANDLFIGSLEDKKDLFDERPLPDWVGWKDSDFQISGSSGNPFCDDEETIANVSSKVETSGSNVSVGGVNLSEEADPFNPRRNSLFEEDVEFVGVEIVSPGKEGLPNEIGPLKRKLPSELPEKEIPSNEFSDASYWRLEQKVGVQE